MNAVDMLELMTKFAKQYALQDRESVLRNSHMNKLDKSDLITQEQVEAVIVDFINFVGVRHGIDLALYTSDLKALQKD